MFRHAFQPYIDEPHKHRDLVLFYDDTALIVRDMYPKAKYHYLVIPRSAKITHKHPYDVFDRDPGLYETIFQYVEKAKDMIMQKVHENNDLASSSMSPTEYRTNFLRAGVHAAPSLANLHIHVISQDFHSPRLKHKKHYNSFTTLFFVLYDDLEPHIYSSPQSYGYASDSDASEESEHDSPQLIRDQHQLNKIIAESPMLCSYCRADFGKGFSRLKLHLEMEYRKTFCRTAKEEASTDKEEREKEEKDQKEGEKIDQR